MLFCTKFVEKSHGVPVHSLFVYQSTKVYPVLVTSSGNPTVAPFNVLTVKLPPWPPFGLNIILICVVSGLNITFL